MLNIDAVYPHADSTRKGASLGLLALMAGISEEYWCAGWIGDLDVALWKMITDASADRTYGHGLVTDRQIELLRLLAEEAGGWWTDGGENYVSTAEWKAIVAGISG